MSNGRVAGLALVLLSAAAFATSGSLAGSLIDTGWTPAAAVIFRMLIAAAVLTVPAVLEMRGRWSLLRRGVPAMLTYGLVAVAGAQFAFFNAIAHLSVGVALLLEYQGTILVVAWLWLRHGRRPRPMVLLGALVALAGLALVLDVLGGFRLDGIGVLWGLVAAVGLATFYVMAGNDTQQVPPLTLSCAGLWVGALVMAGAAATGLVPFRTATVPVELADRRVSWLVPVLGLAIVAAAVGYVLGIFGARLLGATLASFVGLSEVLFAVAFAWFFIGQTPTVLQAVGGVVVVAGVALVRLGELRTPATAEPLPAEDPLPV